MAHLLNEKSSSRSLKACNYCATVVTVVSATYPTSGSVPGCRSASGTPRWSPSGSEQRSAEHVKRELQQNNQLHTFREREL
jgi:hypothetical protein